MVKTNLAMLMNIETVESKACNYIGRVRQERERNDIQRGKEFRCCVVDVVLTPSSINILVEGR